MSQRSFFLIVEKQVYCKSCIDVYLELNRIFKYEAGKEMQLLHWLISGWTLRLQLPGGWLCGVSFPFLGILIGLPNSAQTELGVWVTQYKNIIYNNPILTPIANVHMVRLIQQYTQKYSQKYCDSNYFKKSM